MIRVLILDDEPAAVNTLTLLLKRYAPELKDVVSTTNALEALEKVTTYKPHLMFLDIQMPRMNGFEFLKRVGNVNFEIIFTTAYDQYAIKAIRFSALDYLLKPIDATELRNAVNRFVARRSEDSSEQRVGNLFHNVQPGKESFRLAVSTTTGIFFFETSDIIRLEAEGSYTTLYFANRKPLMASRTLKDFEDMLLTQDFIRTHKSHLVNKKYVKSMHPDGSLEMTDQSLVEVSRRRRAEVQRTLRNNL